MKATVLFLALGMGIGLFACGQDKKPESSPVAGAAPPEKPEIAIDPANYAILTYDSTFGYLFPVGVTPAALNEAEMQECEKLVQVIIDNYNKKQVAYAKSSNPGNQNLNLDAYQIRLADYKRQYIAAGQKGEKLVYINYLCRVSGGADWKKKIYQVNDGGNCYFQVLLNLDRKNILKFSVNGNS